MTQAKHTPAPWEVRQAPSVNSRDYDIFQAGVSPSAGKIARVPGREGREQISIANARLIAAAPELLEALKDILDRFKSCIAGGNGELDDDAPAIKKANAAIAKAKGGVA